MKLLEFKDSTRKDKKYMVKLEDGGKIKTIHFGAKGYQDFTEHNQEERKERYIHRHQPRENWFDPMTAGFWARWILWNKPTIQASLSDTIKKFNLK